MDCHRQLSIKTGSVRRLGGDYRSYASEYDTYRQQLEAAIQTADAHAIRRAREFVDECHATRVDIRLRLADACTQLDAYMADNTQLAGSDEWTKAQQTLQSNRPQQEEVTGAAVAQSAQQQQPQPSAAQPLPRSDATDSLTGGVGGGHTAGPAVAAFHTVPSPPPDRFSVAVYGGSQAKSGDASYERAKQLGRRLAQEHFHIVRQCNTTQHITIQHKPKAHL